MTPFWWFVPLLLPLAGTIAVEVYLRVRGRRTRTLLWFTTIGVTQGLFVWVGFLRAEWHAAPRTAAGILLAAVPSGLVFVGGITATYMLCALAILWIFRLHHRNSKP